VNDAALCLGGLHCHATDWALFWWFGLCDLAHGSREDYRAGLLPKIRMFTGVGSALDAPPNLDPPTGVLGLLGWRRKRKAALAA
jgi:hypothetical protein